MYKLIVVCIFSVLTLINAELDVPHLRCLVCKAALDELDIEVKKLDPTIQQDIGGYRLDSKGDLRKQTVSQAKSELVLSDIIDRICSKMDDYVRVTWKSNGTLTIMKMLINNQMNSELSNVDFITDDDLNKSLKYYCEGILEEFEDEVIGCYAQDVDDIKLKICAEDAKLCPAADNTVPDPEENDREEL